MAPKNPEFDFKEISFNPFEFQDGKIFRDDRDPDLNHFDEINISSKEATYINETDIKNLSIWDTNIWERFYSSC